MKDESQIEDMREALRGDRERAEARRQSMEDVRSLLQPAAPVSAPAPQPRRSLIDRLLGR